MDALGLQTILSLYDTTGNTEICAFSGSTVTTNLSPDSLGSELKRVKTKAPITLIGELMFAYDNLYIEYENTRILTYPSIGSNAAVRSIKLTNSSSTQYATLSIYIDDDTIILRGQNNNSTGYSIRYAGLFLVFH